MHTLDAVIAHRMRNLRVWLRTLALLALACCASLAIADDAAPALTGPALRAALLRGGYVLYFRHAATDFGQNDERMTTFEDCTQQRNLTERGRAEARAIGAEMRRLKVPIADVLASPFCRTRESAELIFGRARVDARVRGGPASPDDPQRYAALRALLSTPIEAGANLAIVSHGNPFRAVAGPPYLAEGEAAVVEPLGAQGFRIVARITKDGWRELAP
ncbi:MAG TPA: histidine phosphatase family protein [Casimicrobiaceae bacterium]